MTSLVIFGNSWFGQMYFLHFPECFQLGLNKALCELLFRNYESFLWRDFSKFLSLLYSNGLVDSKNPICMRLKIRPKCLVGVFVRARSIFDEHQNIRGEATIESQNKLSPNTNWVPNAKSVNWVPRQLSPKQITLMNLPNADNWVPNVKRDNWKGCIIVVWLGRFAPSAK